LDRATYDWHQERPAPCGQLHAAILTPVTLPPYVRARIVDGIEAGIVAHLPYARAVASRAIDPRCRGADREDLIAWGVLRLMQAGRKMQPLTARLPARAERGVPVTLLGRRVPERWRSSKGSTVGESGLRGRARGRP